MVTSLEMLAQAKKHHRARDLARAEVLCRQILEAEPANAEALHLLGVCAHFAGGHAEAVNNFQEALRHNPRQRHRWQRSWRCPGNARAAGRSGCKSTGRPTTSTKDMASLTTPTRP